jgi:hypothetical protein
MRRGSRIIGVAALLVGAIGALASTSPAGAAAPVETKVFAAPGTYTWKVPPGVKVVTFDVFGAGGGGTSGGRGAHVRATINVSKNGSLTIVVGGHGGGPDVGGTGGFNGGANGGAAGLPLSLPQYNFFLPGGTAGSGGGGASDVRVGPAGQSTLGQRLVVAGGGGGAAGGAGGDGSAPGGDGGPGQITYNFLPPDIIPGGVGGAGALGSGVTGENGPDATIEFAATEPGVIYAGNGGGGGGGGLYGGGGGQEAASGAVSVLAWSGVASGGGGGSSLVPSQAVCPSAVVGGAQSGDGRVVVTFQVGTPTHACP